MKLCISATGPETASKIDPAFGRAPFFHVIDTLSMAREVIENQAGGGQGAGISAARLVADRGVQAVLTGVVGPNAMDILQSSNIVFYEGASPGDSVQEALEKFMRGEFDKGQGTGAGEGFPAGSGRAMGRGTGQCRAQGGQGRGMGLGGAKGRCRR